MESAHDTVTRKLRECEKLMQKLPSGYLTVQPRKNGNRLYWVFQEKKGNEVRRIQKCLQASDFSIAKGLQQKRLCKIQIKAYKNNLKWIRNFLKHYIPCDEDILMTQIKEPYCSLPGFEQMDHAKQEAVKSENPYYREHLIFRNSIGECFRSKAEMHISELLLNKNILYRYEEKLEIDGEIKYPDFVVKKSGSNERKYIEYLGMMDRDDYGASAMKKIKWYLDHGFVPGRDVIFLYENDRSGMDLAAIQNQIEMLLRI